MKRIKMLVIGTSFIFLAGNSALAGCNLPKEVHEGAKLEMYGGMAQLKVTVKEIDKKTCWINVEEIGANYLGGVYWVNPNTVTIIKTISK